jgi:hypothetical protein
VKILGFLVSLAFFVGGIYLLGNAFFMPGVETIAFIGGILTISIGLAIPFHILKRVDG